MSRTGIVVALVSLLAFTAAPALAQRTGGSFGGSRSFGGGSSSSSSSSSGRSSFGGGSSFGSSSSSFGSGNSRPSTSSFGSRPPSSSFTFPSSIAPRSSITGSSSSSTSSPYHAPVYVPLPVPVARIPVSEYRRPRASDPALASGTGTTSSEFEERNARFPTYENGPMPVVPGIVGGLIGMLGALGLAAMILSTYRPMPNSPQPVAEEPACDVRRVSIAFDWTQRASLQASLDALASSGDLDSVAGLYRAATAARSVLVKSLDGARYAAFQSFHMTPRDAEKKFAALNENLRERYAIETVRNASRLQAPDVQAREEEGAGFVVVSFVVASTRVLQPPPRRMDRDMLGIALSGSLPTRADELVGLEVIWSPAVESDRMSSAELEVLYPELIRLDGLPGAGRIACSYCRAIYAGELGRCPACGASISLHS